MSRKHCLEFDSYKKFDTDKSNRLALSKDFHSFYDGINCTIPVFNISIHSVSDKPIVNGRYQVELLIKLINSDYKKKVFGSLKKESYKVENDDLAMITSVLILDPVVFRKCIEWKYKDIDDKWKEYFSMTPAVD